jgi:hypothetical protein
VGNPNPEVHVKTMLRITAAAVALAFAVPALACSEDKPTKADAAQKAPAKTQVAKAEKQQAVKTAPAVK